MKKIILVYKELPDFETEDVDFDDRMITIDGYGEHLYLDKDDLQ